METKNIVDLGAWRAAKAARSKPLPRTQTPENLQLETRLVRAETRIADLERMVERLVAVLDEVDGKAEAAHEGILRLVRVLRKDGGA